MARGGYRENAGRKQGVGNQLSEALRNKINAKALIGFLQDVALGTYPEATLSERKEAAVALLKKVLPDVAHQQIENIAPPAIIITQQQADDILSHAND